MRENEDSRVPVTIEELKDLCTQRGINLYQLGFYLGSDHIGPNAYGIYKDYWTNDFIVYRNIEDGSKTVLYQGQDEKEAIEKISEQLNKVLLNTGAEDTKAPDIDGNSEAEDSPYVSAKNQSPDIESVYSDDDHLDSYADNTSEVDEDQNQEPVRESPSSKDEYNSYTSRPSNGNESFESSWMDIQTPIMRAAANEDVTDEGDERSSDKEIEFTGKDVKDLKTGVIFCAGKFFYYLGRLCYYISLIFYYLFRSFDGAGYEINLILTGKRKKVKNRDKDTDTLHSDKEDTIKEAAFEDSDIDSGAGNAPVFFDEKEYDDKVELIGAKIQFYISRFFFYIGKHSLIISRYCYLDIDDKFKPMPEEAESGYADKADASNEEEGSERVARTDASNEEEGRRSVTKEYSTKTIVSESESEAYKNEAVYNKSEVYDNEAAYNNTNAYNSNTNYYQGSANNIHSLVKDIDPNVKILTSDYSETYDLTAIAEEYNDKKDDSKDDSHDDSINALFRSLDDEELEYPDNDEDHTENKLGEQIYLLILVALALVLFIIFLLAGVDVSSRSGRNDRNYYNYEYNTNNHKTYNNSWRW